MRGPGKFLGAYPRPCRGLERNPEIEIRGIVPVPAVHNDLFELFGIGHRVEILDKAVLPFPGARKAVLRDRNPVVRTEQLAE